MVFLCDYVGEWVVRGWALMLLVDDQRPFCGTYLLFGLRDPFGRFDVFIGDNASHQTYYSQNIPLAAPKSKYFRTFATLIGVSLQKPTKLKTKT